MALISRKPRQINTGLDGVGRPGATALG